MKAFFLTTKRSILNLTVLFYFPTLVASSITKTQIMNFITYNKALSHFKNSQKLFYYTQLFYDVQIPQIVSR